MKTKDSDIKQRMIGRYTDQPDGLPASIRTAIEAETGKEPIQLYALCDLDASLTLTQSWVVLTASSVLMARDSGEVRIVRHIQRQDIQSIRVEHGLSSTRLILLGDRDQPALMYIRYTHRQRRTMENIQFVLERQLEGQDVIPSKPDTHYYRDGLTKPVLDAQASVAGNRLTVVWRLLAYLRPYRKQFLLGAGAAALTTALSLLPPYLTKHLIDSIVKPFTSGEMGHDAALRAGWIVLGTLAATYLLRSACQWIHLRLMSTMGEYVARDLRSQLYEHLQKLSLRFYSSKNTGSIMSRVSHDTDRLWEFIAFGVCEVFLAAITLIGLSVVLLALDLRLGLLMTLPLPLILWWFFLHGRRMQRFFLRAWRKWSSLSEVLSDTIPGIRVVKAFNQEQREVGRFNQRNNACLEEFNSLHQMWTKFWPLLLFSLQLLALLVWVFAIPRIMSDDAAASTRLSVGTFIGFILYMGMFFQPIETIGMMSRMMNRATSSALRVFEILDTQPEIVTASDAVHLEPCEGRVTFDDVSFAYDGVQQVLKGISFDIKPGEMVGLVGPSGSGKSTVINLVARFYDVTDGQIRIDGVPIKELDTGSYRRQIGIVLQDPYLFHGTILDNIRYGMPGAGLDEVVAAARAANAHHFICRLAHGYDSVVGERGLTLSGGERQRVSIARAIVNDPRILILDEATSSVDTETERNIQEALDRLIQGRTTIAIAHRLSTLQRASRLFVIERGRLVEEGSHAELLAKPDGRYRKLSELQKELHEMYGVTS